ncbi:Lpp/OprI family alanine-zipper lipoprotein [Pseudomonas sp. TE3610]
MNTRLTTAFCALLALTAGCSQQRANELDARLEGIEANAATARLRAGEALVKAEQAMQIATHAQRDAEAANERAMRIISKAARK